MAALRFGYTICTCPTWPRASIYERALGQQRRFVHESGQYAELDTGPTTLALAAHELAAANVPGLYRPERRTGAQPTFEVCFVTDDVQGAFDRAVAAGAAEVTPPQTKPWGQDVAYVRDSDGNLVEMRRPPARG